VRTFRPATSLRRDALVEGGSGHGPERDLFLEALFGMPPCPNPGSKLHLLEFERRGRWCDGAVFNCPFLCVMHFAGSRVPGRPYLTSGRPVQHGRKGRMWKIPVYLVDLVSFRAEIEAPNHHSCLNAPTSVDHTVYFHVARLN